MTSKKSIINVDRQLTARIKETMGIEEDPNEIADYLRENHPREYARRKVSDFRKIVSSIFAELKKMEKETPETPENNEKMNSKRVSPFTDVLSNNSPDKKRTESAGSLQIINGENEESNDNAQEDFGDDQLPTHGQKNDNNNIINNDDDSDDLEIQEDKSTAKPLYPNREAMQYHNARMAQQMAAQRQQNIFNKNMQTLANSGFPVSGTTDNFDQSGQLASVAAAINATRNGFHEDEEHSNQQRNFASGKKNSRRGGSKWDQKKGGGPANKRRRRRTRKESSTSESNSDSENDNLDSDFKKLMVFKKSDISLENDVILPKKTKNYLKKVLTTLKHIDLFNHINVSPPRNLLLHGPVGCGKTLLAKSLPNFVNAEFMYISGTDLLNGIAGQSEKRIRKIFEEACNPTPEISIDKNTGAQIVKVPLRVLVFDDFETIASKSSKTTPVEKRMISQFCNSLDMLGEKHMAHVIVIACTSKPDNIDPSLRRAGRFDHEIVLPIPGEESRKEILSKFCRNVKVTDDVDFNILARMTPGYVGSDLDLLIKEAAQICVGRFLEENPSLIEESNKNSNVEETVEILDDEMDDTKTQEPEEKQNEISRENLKISPQDFEHAMSTITPASKREGFACVPDVTWDDIGALEDIREQLRLSIVAPIRYPQIFKAYGQNKPPGVLLAGPPGNGKTLLAKAVANESGLNFIAVNGPELLNMYVGESERAVRSVFTRARHSSPCVIFFDEIDAFCPKRQSTAAGGTEHSARLVNQMLTEMDGIQSGNSSLNNITDDSTIFVMAATNRPDMLDPALLRPGRFDKTLYVGLPKKEGRSSIIRALTRKKPTVAENVNIDILLADQRFDKLSGADIASVVREAAMIAMHADLKKCLDNKENKFFDEKNDGNEEIGAVLLEEHFMKALEKVKPSISDRDHAVYKKLEESLKAK